MTSLLILVGSVDKVMHVNIHLKMDIDEVVTTGVRPHFDVLWALMMSSLFFLCVAFLRHQRRLRYFSVAFQGLKMQSYMPRLMHWVPLFFGDIPHDVPGALSLLDGTSSVGAARFHGDTPLRLHCPDDMKVSGSSAT